MRLTRRDVLTGGVALAALACSESDGCSGATVEPAPPPEPTPPAPLPRPFSTGRFPGQVRPDGNVRREYARVGGVRLPVEWSSPVGDVRLALAGRALLLNTARDGSRTLGPSDLELGEARELVDKRLGASVLLEARRTLAVAQDQP